MASSPSDSNTKRSRFREGLRNTIHRFKHTIKTSSQPEPPTSPASHSPLLLEVPLSRPSNAVVNTHILPSTQIGENTIQSNSGNSNPPATRATPELSTGENAVWRGLDASLRFLQKTVGAFSPLGAILQDLVDCLDIFKAGQLHSMEFDLALARISEYLF
ncbi:hypothetical protein B0J17DRAFT_389984 [Rhizoctonia solani]|nr:hypothetical protein B0J17DRAFT_389984 [Rhizoctonia solani]